MTGTTVGTVDGGREAEREQWGKCVHEKTPKAPQIILRQWVKTMCMCPHACRDWWRVTTVPLQLMTIEGEYWEEGGGGTLRTFFFLSLLA